ncbi:MAG: hypothetical protein ABH879_10060 [archaeon]
MGGIRGLVLNLGLAAIALVFCFAFLEAAFRIYLGSSLHYEYFDDSWALKPNQAGFTYPNGKLATVGSEGYRGSAVPAAGQTILFLGDSFIFGFAIGDNDTVPVLFESMTEGFRVINGGVPGYGIDHMIQIYDCKYARYRPQYVILSYLEPDIFRQKRPQDRYYQRELLARKLVRTSSLLGFLRPRVEVFNEILTGDESLKEKNYEPFFREDMQRIAEFNEHLKKQNATLILHPWIYKKSQDAFYNRLSEMAESEGIRIFPNYYPAVFEEYQGELRELYAEDGYPDMEDGHPSEIQTRRLAELMARDFMAICRD